jgi:hypothetical protein
MKIVLAFILILTGNFLFATEQDSSDYDTNYRLYDVQPHKTVDTNVQIRLVEPEPRRKNRSDEWITGPLNSGPIGIGSNYDSIHNINPKVAGFISVCFLSFVLYIIMRVRRGLKKDKRNRRD